MADWIFLVERPDPLVTIITHQDAGDVTVQRGDERIDVALPGGVTVRFVAANNGWTIQD